MLEEKDVRQLNHVLKKVFAFPIARLTFKEVQRGILTVFKENRERANHILESFLTGVKQQEESVNANSTSQALFKRLVDEYGIRVRLAKDVFEKGEFISFLSSDMINPSHPIFINQIKRVDGEEFQFLTEPEGVIHVLKHFMGRLEELEKGDKSQSFFKEQTQELKLLRDRLDKIIS